MRKRTATSIGGCVMLCLVIACLTTSAANAASAASTLKAFRGNWACSFEANHGFFGETAGIAQLSLDRQGNLTGEEIVASAEPHFELDIELDGKLAAQDNGMIRGEVTVHLANLPDVPDQVVEIVCVGFDREGDRYRRMHCLDVFDEPEGTEQVAVLECGSQG